jgi:Zn-dependent metalloprotease
MKAARGKQRSSLGRSFALASSLAIAFAIANASNSSAQVPSLVGANAAFQQLAQANQGDVTVAVHPATGAVRFLQIGPKALRKTEKFAGIQATQAASVSFFRKYGALFGMKDPYAELSLNDTRRESSGATHFLFDQKYRGLRVFAGQLRTHFNEDRQLTTVTGTFVPGIQVDVAPSLSAEAAIRAARSAVMPKGGATAPIAAEGAELLVYRTGLFQGVPGVNALAYAVTLNDGAAIHEQVMVDAHSGQVLDRIPLTYDDLYRKLFEVNPDHLVWEEGDALPGSLNADQTEVITRDADTYGFFKHTFGRDSYDGQGAPMLTINNDPRISCPNANWNGITTNYCAGVIADDVIAHEWAHAYTQFTHGLAYMWQPGALNESYSDIWGEVVDQLNAGATDHDIRRADGTCADGKDSTRWLMGEDTTAFGGAIRDLWSPGCKGYPDKVSDFVYYCGTGDSGGVHKNSSVPNHGFALLVDGGAFNGVTVTGIGLTKAASIYWRAQTVYQGVDTDFAAHADALEASCNDLVGKELPELSLAGPSRVSGETIDPADCAAVQAMVLAVELRTPPTQCNFKPLLAQNPPPLCQKGGGAPTPFFTEDFEHGIDGWQTSHESPNPKWPGQDWVVSAQAPAHESAALFAIDPNAGECGGDGDQSSVIRVETPEITVPQTAGNRFEASFDHYVASELGWDGGNLEYSVNGGAYRRVPSSLFLYNGYNLMLSFSENTNPLAGQYAFTGTDGGAVRGSWGQSQIDLTTLGLKAGDRLRFRFNFGKDGCGGMDGWYIDNLQVLECK